MNTEEDAVSLLQLENLRLELEFDRQNMERRDGLGLGRFMISLGKPNTPPTTCQRRRTKSR